MALPVNAAKRERCMFVQPENQKKCRRFAILAACKCSKIFCEAHRLSFLHACTFDHKEAHRKMLKRKLCLEESDLRVNRESRDSSSGDVH